MTEPRKIERLKTQVANLRQQLKEAQETLQAITGGEIDALVIDTRDGEKIFTLEGADTVYRIALENVNEGVITLSIEGNILFSNHYFASMLQTDLNKIIGASLFDFVNHEDRVHVTNLLERDTGRSEVSLVSNKGIHVPVYLSIKRLPLDQPVACAIVTDLTQQKRNAELVRSSRLIQSILEQSPNPVMVCDSAGIITYASKTAHILSGHPIGRHLDDIMNGLEIEGKPIRFSSLRENRITSDKVATYRNNNHATDFLFRFARVKQGRLVKGYVISLADVTELKNAERLKDDFIGMVSHELKTPLTVVTGAISTIMSSKLRPEESQELMEDAAWGADNMADIVDNLLELSRWQANRLILQSKPVDIAKTVSRIIDMFSNRSENHQLVADISANLPMVNADITRIERVLENLIDNAIKYSPDGGEIKISAKKQRNYVLISVSDQGIGISSTDQPKLFEPFQRLENLSRAVQGIGLGLVVCRRLIEAHGGRIWIDSNVGKGSTFNFTVPTNRSPRKA